MDFDGRYPSKATAARLWGDSPEMKFSNDYFRQLFWSGDTQSEKIFWYFHPGVTDPIGPDDVITNSEGELEPSEILKPGGCYWACVTGQTNVSNPARPLVLCPFLPGTMRFDPKPWDRKAIIVRIDSSVRAERLFPEGHVLQADARDLFDPASDLWSPDPVPEIAQPER